MLKRLLTSIVAMACVACGGTPEDAPRQAQHAARAAATRAASDYYPVLQQLYVAYFGRPADPEGMKWHANNLLAAGAPTDLRGLLDAIDSNATIRAVVDVFATSTESNALYGGDNDAFVTAIYHSLFNRDPDAAGKAWWIGVIEKGLLSRTQAALSIMASARDSDVDRVQLKANVAASFTGGLDNPERVMAYDGMAANEVARSMLSKAVPGTDAATLAKSVTDTIAALVDLRGGGFIYDVAADVPADQLAIIKGGFVIAQDFLDSHLGGGIPAAQRKGMTVKVVATGLGDQEPGGGGSCCVGLALGSNNTSLMRPFFDVKHPQWDLPPTTFWFSMWTIQTDHQKVVTHEYTHDWQSSLGCLSISTQPLGFWLNEGIAEYVAYEAMFAHGAMQRSDARKFALQGAYSTGELGEPLRDFGGTSAPLWPGHVGYVAVDYLAKSAPQGMLSVRTLCEQVAAGATVPAAFRTAFGVDMETFYNQFEAMRPQLIAEAKGS